MVAGNALFRDAFYSGPTEPPLFSFLSEEGEGGVFNVRFSNLGIPGLGPDKEAQERDRLIADIERSVDQQIGELEQQISQISSNLDAGSTDVQEQRQRITQLEGLKAFAKIANNSQLHGLHTMVTSPISSLQGQTIDVKTYGGIIAATALAERMGEHFEHYLEMSGKWSKEFHHKAREFESYADKHGFSAALRDKNFSYSNAGPAHAYLLKHDKEYLAERSKLEKDAQERRNQADENLKASDELAKKYGVDTRAEDEAIRKAREAIRDAQHNGSPFISEQRADLYRAERERIAKIDKEVQERGTEADKQQSNNIKQSHDALLEKELQGWRKEVEALDKATVRHLEADLKKRNPNLTEEELKKQIDQQMQPFRSEYKEREASFVKNGNAQDIKLDTEGLTKRRTVEETRERTNAGATDIVAKASASLPDSAKEQADKANAGDKKYAAAEADEPGTQAKTPKAKGSLVR